MEQENKNKTSIPGSYDLKHEAMDALTNQDADKVPEYSKEELEKYRAKSKLHIPDWLKVIAIKAWFYGAVCFFFLWGLGTYISSYLDMLVVLGIAMGMVIDLLLNNSLRFLEKNPGSNDVWMMICPKGVRSFFLNIVYGCVIMFCVFMFYNFLNYCIITVTGAENTIPIGVEPLLFGLLCMGFDLMFVGIKRLVISIVHDAKKTARSGR